MSPARMERIESAVRVVLKFRDAFNRHDVETMIDLVSDDYVVEPHCIGAKCQGKDAAERYWREYFRDFPQAHIAVEEIFGSGGRCIMRWGMNAEPGPGPEPSLQYVDIFKVRSGMICEQLSYAKFAGGT